jgi:hypothetical protein
MSRELKKSNAEYRSKLADNPFDNEDVFYNAVSFFEKLLSEG